MKFSWKRLRRVAVAVAVLGAALMVASPSLAAGPKFYDAEATATVYAGVTETVTVTLTNQSRNKISFGSANIDVPSGISLSNDPALDTATGTVALNNGVLELRNLDVERNASVTVSVTGSMPCDTTTGQLVWTTDVRQSNDFNGTDNKFALSDGGPATTDTVGPCVLAFTAQPKDTNLGDATTSVERNPAGTPVQVSVMDARLSSAGIVDEAATISLSSTVTLSGTTSAATSSGTASFAPVIGVVGQGYTLLASAPSLTGATSDAFDVGRPSATVTCAIDQLICETGEINGPAGGTANIVLNDDDAVTATLTASYDSATLDCSSRGYSPTSDQLVFDVITGDDLTGLTKTVTFSKPLAGGSTDAWDYQVCFQAPYDFPALDLGPGELEEDFTNFDFTDNTDQVGSEWRGLLLPCDYGVEPSAASGEEHSPCVVSRTVSGGIVTVVVEVPALDPGMRF